LWTLLFRTPSSASTPGANVGWSANGYAAAARPKLLGEQLGQWKLFGVTDPFVVVNARQAPRVV
jgi:hypothetical protein